MKMRTEKKETEKERKKLSEYLAKMRREKGEKIGREDKLQFQAQMTNEPMLGNSKQCRITKPIIIKSLAVLPLFFPLFF